MTRNQFTKLLNAAGLDAVALESPALGTKTIKYYHIDKQGKTLTKKVSEEDLKRALDLICEHVHYHG